MQRLEVSGAVRPICGWLGVKRLNLIKTRMMPDYRDECLCREGTGYDIPKRCIISENYPTSQLKKKLQRQFHRGESLRSQNC